MTFLMRMSLLLSLVRFAHEKTQIKAGPTPCPTWHSGPQKCDRNSGLLFTLFTLLLKFLRGSQESAVKAGILGGPQSR